MTCVVQPPPLAKCGSTLELPASVTLRSDTGSVVIKNSPRSFVNPRKAMTEMGTLELKVNVPWTLEPPLNGDSFRNADI